MCTRYQSFLALFLFLSYFATTVVSFSLSSSAVYQRRQFITRHASSAVSPRSSATLLMGVRKRAWAEGDLSDRDVFSEEDDAVADGSSKKPKFKLEAETTFFESAPSPTEILLPAISVLTVIGIVPFIAAVSRQFWVKYKFTSRRISIQSGIGGKVQTEIIYPDVAEVRYVYRAFGSAGDMVLFLKDGAKVEMRHVPNFNDVYTYVLSKCDEECVNKSMKLTLTAAN